MGIKRSGRYRLSIAKQKPRHSPATKLHTGAKRIDDHFGFVDRYGDTDLMVAQYKIVNARTGRDTNVRFQVKKMLLKEREFTVMKDF